jgi:predicted GTPase
MYKSVCWKGTHEGFVLIDTPGLNNGEKNDIYYVNNMIKRIGELEEVNAIFCVING